MKKITWIIFALLFAFVFCKPVQAAGTVTEVTASEIKTNEMVVSGKTDGSVLAAVVVQINKDETLLTMESIPVVNNLFSGKITGLNLTEGESYQLRVADFDGGAWKSITITVPSSTSGGDTGDSGNNNPPSSGDSGNNNPPSSGGSGNNNPPSSGGTGGSGIIIPPSSGNTGTGSGSGSTTNTDKNETDKTDTDKIDTDKTDTGTTEPTVESTETETTTNKDGSVTTTTTTVMNDGSKTVEENTVMEDGSTKEVKTETAADGSVVVTTTTVAVDGSSREVVKETETNDAGKSVQVTTTTTKDVDGQVTGVTEKLKIKSAAKNTSVTVTVKRDAEGSTTNSTASVVVKVPSASDETKGKSVKTILYKSVMDQIKEASEASNTKVSVKVTDAAGKTLYTIKADTKELAPKKTLYLYQLDTMTGEYTMVNAKKYVVSEKGNVSVSMNKKGTYELVTSKEAKTIETKILATVKPAKTTASITRGKTTTFQLSSKANTSNISKITYSLSDKSLATVSKSGKITAKKAGKVVVTAKVTLKNGTTKKVKMTITVE